VRGFSDAAEIAMVEASPSLKREQVIRLRPARLNILKNWRCSRRSGDHHRQQPRLHGDRQYARDGNAWRERQIGLVSSRIFTFGLDPPADLPNNVAPRESRRGGAGLDSWPRPSPAASASPGRALFIDRPRRPLAGDTLRAFRSASRSARSMIPGSAT
jgi:hypothetical protein